jgi:hypothetical protein
MPPYLRRTLANYPTEFWRSPANPGGLEFYCCFCLNYYRTSSGVILHMRRCSENPAVEYGLDNDEINEDEISDFLNTHKIIGLTVQNYIRTNELEPFANRTGTEIQDIIQTKLIQNGYTDQEDVNRVKFIIYEFFFEISIAEKTEHGRLSAERLTASMRISHPHLFNMSPSNANQ